MYFECKNISSLTEAEPVKTAYLTFIDAHHHLWDLSHCHYPWLMARGAKRFFGDPSPIQKNYLPADFLQESQRYVPSASVHIQVGVSSEDEIRETKWLQSLSPVPQAIVAATDLSAPDLPGTLDAHACSPRLRGIRQILGRHREEDKKHGSDALLDSPHFIRGLHELAARGLSFDLQMIPQQMPRVIAVLRQVPELRVALCHCGSPWDQDAEGLANWRSGLRQLAELPTVSCKVSGLGMFKPDWTPQDLRPLIHDVIDAFSPGRVMFGSNFPVDKLYNSYEALWRAYELAVEGFSNTEKQQMFYQTAADFYRI